MVSVPAWVGPAGRTRPGGRAGYFGFGAATFAAFLWLTGCATPVPLAGTPALTASGRLSIRVEASPTRPPQSLSAAFEWRGDGARGELTLLSPLGTQMAQARWSPEEVVLVTSDGQARFDTLDALAERALGERVPLVAWPDWLAGRPWPGAPSVPLVAAAAGAAAGGPAGSAAGIATGIGFEQLGWRVDLSRHAEGHIAALRSAPPVVTVRIVLDGEVVRARP